MMGRVLERLARAAASRPAVTLGIVLALALGGGALALRLQPNTSSDTFVNSSSPEYKASLDDNTHFGGDPVVILIREPLPDLVETKDLATVSQLEACLAGQVVVANQQLQAFTPAPAGSPTPYGGWGSPCGKLMKAQPAQVVYGPGTFLNRAVAAVNTEITQIEAGAQQTVQTAKTSAYQLALAKHLSKQRATTLANAAGQIAQEQETTNLLQMYLNSGITGQPRIDDPQFIPEIVFDQTRGANQPKSRFAYLFPTADSALIQVRLKASLTPSQQAQAIKWIEQAVRMPMFRSAYHGTYTVSGVPVVTNDLASTITGSIAGLLAAAIFVMGVVLLLVFRNRPRLLPLGIALAAAGITFGAVSLVGASLTMASIAVLPILIGLAVDYAVQFQARTEEVSGDVAQAAIVAAPTIATAALATAAGFLALLLSPVPMVRGFGELLIVGIAIALACALTMGSAALVLARRRRSAPRFSPPSLGNRRRVSARRGGDHRGCTVFGLVARELGRALRGGSGGPPAWARVVGGAGAGRPRLGRRHADAGPVRRDQARAVEHAGAAEPAHARARHRRVGRDRRARALEQRRDAEDDQLDGRLREHAARALRLRRGEGVLERDAVPGAVAARPVLLGEPGDGELVRQLAVDR